jgi:hypothetical protein
VKDFDYNNLLYDFYGDLLTERQRDIYCMYYCEDMSMGEIGERLGITRQAVNFSLKETQKAFDTYEQALGLLKSHKSLREYVAALGMALRERNFTESSRILLELEESHGL